jgi:predicted transcriptional regulator
MMRGWPPPPKSYQTAEHGEIRITCGDILCAAADDAEQGRARLLTGDEQYEAKRLAQLATRHKAKGMQARTHMDVILAHLRNATNQGGMSTGALARACQLPHKRVQDLISIAIARKVVVRVARSTIRYIGGQENENLESEAGQGAAG